MDDINIWWIIPVFLVAFGISFFMTPISMWIARMIGAVDVPTDNRRMHRRAIPRFGGMAIFLSVTITILLFEGDEPKIRIALLGGAFIYALGALDDVFNLPAWVKFTVQTAVAVFMCALGIRITVIANYFEGAGYIQIGLITSFIISVIWIVGITNTINLIDGLDGLAAGIATICSFSMAYIAYIRGSVGGMTIVCFAFIAIAGACIGFLPFNYSPARTFMGDGGALFLGYMIAIMSVISPLRRATLVAAVVPIVTLAIPIFDTSFAIIRRIINHQPIMSADGDHLHHRLMESGYGQRRAVLMLYGITGIMGIASILVSRELYKEAVVLAVIAITYLYVFLTDPNHNVAKKKREKKEAEQAAKLAAAAELAMAAGREAVKTAGEENKTEN